MKITTSQLHCAPIRPDVLPTVIKTANTVWFDPNVAKLLAGSGVLATSLRAGGALQAVPAAPDDLKLLAGQALETFFPSLLVMSGVLPGPEEFLTKTLREHAPALGASVQIVSLGVAGWHLWHDWQGQTAAQRTWSVVKVGAQTADMLCEYVPALKTLAPGLAAVGMIVKIGDEFCAMTLKETSASASPFG